MQSQKIPPQTPKRIFLVTLIGADGSGKSTVLAALLANSADLIKVEHGLKPFYKTRAGDGIWNHAYPPRGSLFSTIKLLFRALVWRWEYLVRYSPLLAKGNVLICDRFYFDDIIIDPLKYRYGGPLWLARTLRSLLPAPEVYIFLDVPEPMLMLRKHETTLDELKRLRRAYLGLVHQQPGGYIVDASGPLAEVVWKTQKILNEYSHSNKTGESSMASEKLMP